MTFGGSFTFGEGCLALQSVVLFAFEALSTLVIDPRLARMHWVFQLLLTLDIVVFCALFIRCHC